MSIAPSVQAGRSEDFNYVLSVAGSLGIPLTVDQIIPRNITFSGAIGANILITFPVVATDAGSRWHLTNATSGAHTVTVQAVGGGGSVVLTQGKATSVFWDGTNFTVLASDVALMGAAAAGANADILSMTGLTGGIQGSGGILFDSLQGNQVALSYGYLAKTLPSDANYTLAANERGARTLDVLPPGGGLTAQRNIVLPLVAGALWDVYNGTTQSLQFIAASGTGIVVATLKRATLGCDGNNITRRSADV